MDWCNPLPQKNPCATLKRLYDAASQESGFSEAKVWMYLKSSGSSFHTYSAGKARLIQEKGRKWGEGIFI